ncbi:hypothetical protein EYF80_040119 [Liparis tanakae]|uniref:Uncharacterized protein n=1 Tax=Liparis tanakae TaxID=230148 RepID=A0A4Z2G820_9TELE|nr:hypothetical protein EYF80_040119 [Liparis tanakae]
MTRRGSTFFVIPVAVAIAAHLDVSVRDVDVVERLMMRTMYGPPDTCQWSSTSRRALGLS